jgi:hypothetical protein
MRLLLRMVLALGFSGLVLVSVFFSFGVWRAPTETAVQLDDFLTHRAKPAEVGGIMVSIIGESTFSRQGMVMPLLWTPERILRVYSFDSAGRQVIYTPGVDWDFSNGELRPTEGSKIPDFRGYSYLSGSACGLAPVSLGCTKALANCLLQLDFSHCSPPLGARKFAFFDAPRNPPLSIAYNVYVDYETRDAVEMEERFITARSIRPDPIRRILCFGDSIAAGAHTVAHFYRGQDNDSWCGILRTALSPEVEVLNMALPGGEVTYLSDNLSDFLVYDADIAVISIGMNDHVRGSKNIEYFEVQLSLIVQAFLKRGTTPILVGFFQQNMLWLNEDPLATQKYNEIISKVASRFGVPFVDIREIFDRAYPGSAASVLFTGDFMHHPNNFGHQIYASAILPHLLFYNRLKSEFPFYVPFENF